MLLAATVVVVFMRMTDHGLQPSIWMMGIAIAMIAQMKALGPALHVEAVRHALKSGSITHNALRAGVEVPPPVTAIPPPKLRLALIGA